MAGLMKLNDHFKQRKIKETFGSFRSWIPLTTPSGPQEVESEMEAKLLSQLAFAPGVYDLITQPIIDYTKDRVPHTYTPDIMIQLSAGYYDYPCRYLIEVKRLDDLENKMDKLAEKFLIGRLAEDEVSAAFRIMTEIEIDTPYLANTRELSRYKLKDAGDEALLTLIYIVDDGPIRVDELIRILATQGIDEPTARYQIGCVVAHRIILCDLSKIFNDQTIVCPRPVQSQADQDVDPILVLLRNARNR